VLRKLVDLLPGYQVVDANACLNGARTVKSTTELQLLADASAVVDVAMDVAVAAAVPGARECDVLAEVMATFYRHGAEVPQCNLIVCSGPNTAPMQRFAGDRMIRRGDLVFMDIGACFNGLFSEATRTIACQEPANDTQRAIYRTVYDIHRATIDALRPGATAVEVQAAAAKHYQDSPFHGRMQEMIIAHGIGVGYAEPPFIAPPGKTTPELRLEPGMVLAVVPTIIVPGGARWWRGAAGGRGRGHRRRAGRAHPGAVRPAAARLGTPGRDRGGRAGLTRAGPRVRAFPGPAGWRRWRSVRRRSPG
jgi:Xaa-Pro aminopeptidase